MLPYNTTRPFLQEAHRKLGDVGPTPTGKKGNWQGREHAQVFKSLEHILSVSEGKLLSR